MKNPDLLAAVACLLAVAVSEGVHVATGERLLSADLEAAAGAFVIAALTRWRLRAAVPKKLADAPTAPIDGGAE